ncbi:Protein patched [Amphibalanus amphitrite]|uniref:Protein patched n=1 Tax=Amphibalanus amphitrite TaxID=1232801 RepID=A0A6A4VLF7_AMPAM|nr:Protein patched [Amphibalanus amphitrite]
MLYSVQHQVYSIKMFLFADQLEYDEPMQEKVQRMAQFLLLFYVVAWLRAPVAEDAPANDLNLYQGGRLQRELEYVRSSLGEGAGSLHQIVVQTPREDDSSVLRAEALLAHYEAVKAASQVSVDMHDITWRLRDLCYAPGFPVYEEHLIDQIMKKLIPCSFVTPLDCFWEGSKLLGPEFPVHMPKMSSEIRWTNLDPEQLLSYMNSTFGSEFQFDTLQKYMKRAGITNGYQRRPCLNTSDPECPETASNRASGARLDIGAELTGGCYGFATKHMHWPEQLIVGGTEKNRTGHIVRAKALQTVIQLMGERNLYEYWADTYKTHSMDWSLATAKAILDAWQLKFTQEIQRHTGQHNRTRPFSISSFSMASLNSILRHFADLDLTRVGIGYGLMLVYGFFSLVRWSDPVRSQGGLGAAGVLLVTLSVTAGLGLCGLIGIPFNASTTQIIPFLALGLGVDDMFLMAHTYSESDLSCTPVQDRVGEVLRRAGVSVLLTSLCNVMAFLSAAILPIPALRSFSLQACILVVFNVLSILLIFPAMMSVDLRRRRARMFDIVCCWAEPGPEEGHAEPLESFSTQTQQPTKRATVAKASRTGEVTTFVSHGPELDVGAGGDSAPQPHLTRSVESLDSVASTRTLVRADERRPTTGAVFCPEGRRHCRRLGLQWLVERHYLDWLPRRPFKLAVLLASLAAAAAGVWGACQVQDGLDLTDMVPRHSDEYTFLDAQRRYFGFFNMFAVTQGNFEYPTNQQLLHEYHQAFTRVPRVIKNDDGGLPDFWLGMFRDWLLDLQKAFDHDWALGLIDQEQWSRNASEEGILAYKLLVQTGRVEYPIDKSQLPHVRLVEDGIINPKAFYNYLTAWASNDALAYTSSQAQLRPEPKQWLHVASDVELKIPKSQPLVYAQLPFYLNGMATTESIVETIEQVRSICRRFEERGLPNFPAGVPFTFWEQYVGLRFFLGLALLCVFVAVFLVISVVLMNAWAAGLVVLVIGLTVLQLFGVMGLLGLRLSAVPAVILIMSVGIGVEFTVHILLGYLTSLGSRTMRVQRSLEHMFRPVFHGAFSTFLGVLMLAFSEFDFIIRYFFCVLAALVVLGLVNGLVLLPVLLCWIGPPAEVRPTGEADVLPAPSPEPSPPRVRGPRVYRSSSLTKQPTKKLKPAPSQLSLSTITEESSGSQSGTSCRQEARTHDIVVEPQVVVETSYPPGGGERRPAGSDGALITTKVTATTHVKVEVHAPVTCADARRPRRRREAADSDSSNSSQSSS